MRILQKNPKIEFIGESLQKGAITLGDGTKRRGE